MANEQRELERQRLLEARGRGRLSEVLAFIKLSGPGWMQSALTLGGGSLGSSLYLGILAGLSMLWLQPFAMILGVIMLSAISYVTLSTGERPFRAINNHINPVLGWSWLLASLIANMVWSMPQYSLCFSVIEQNLFPSVFQSDGLLSNGNEASETGKWLVSIVILVLCTLITWSYGSGSRGVKIYEAVLKVVVGVIVLCFVGVVIRISATGGIDWPAFFSGFIPDFRQFFAPSETYRPLLDAIDDPAATAYWSDLILREQRDVVLSAVATAVGINMTFLLPYNLLSRGWDKDFRRLAIFDMCTGTFIPFVLATTCVVIAAAAQFHGKLPEGTTIEGNSVTVAEHLQGGYDKIVSARIAAAEAENSELPNEMSLHEKELAARLVRRDAGDLARSLQGLFADEAGQGGRFFSNIVFGLGVVGMTLSTISLLMLISGFIVCEVLDKPPTGWTFRVGCLLSATGILWPLVTGGAKAYLTVVASVFGAMLLPIAYITFFFMMNSKSLMGDNRPSGSSRVIWSLLMGIAVLFASVASVSAVYARGGNGGLWALGGYLLLIVVVQFMRSGGRQNSGAS